jgi:hypothetical protein
VSRPGDPPAPAPEPGGPRAPEGASRLERWVLPYLREPTLWPVLLVVMGHAAAFLAPMMLLGLRDRRGPALAALLGAAGLTGAGVRAESRAVGRPGAFSVALAATWLLAAGAAVAAHRYKIF